ncbi:hypothetical protein HMPREF9193_00323 [Treponema lecithinolyticum ATCC 700332]|uniref:Uncharacterized protein n=1 Tax=Treponema lecithinolyticum ATCC 700332 TaxID=1321815 RepID=A0ABN0P1I3_TRELE|nr:hypothetical protein HMPREF9193_00323 [Treponema lecithinolyticum ATCC 700332]
MPIQAGSGTAVRIALRMHTDTAIDFFYNRQYFKKQVIRMYVKYLRRLFCEV